MKLFAMSMIAAAVISSTPVVADELDDAAKTCQAHHTVRQLGKPQGFDAGWEHCEKIIAAHDKRQAEQDAVDELKNPDLKKSRDLAKGL
jgi:hypothetical protein